MAQITKYDLRFSKEEMIAYFSMQSLDVSYDVSADIFSYTNGWIFAIYLIGLAIKKGDIKKQNPIQATKIDIFNLIDREIFQMISEEFQHFLIQVTSLEFIPSSFLKEMTDDHLSIKSEMVQLSPFIQYDSLSDCYRIHHIFKDFLAERQRLLPENDIREMHIKTAKWHQKKNQNLEAISHYKIYNLYNEILNIILSYTYHVTKETADLFIKLIEQAPDEVIRERPIIRIAMVNFMFSNNRVADAKQELIKIRKEYEALPETKENLAILGEAYIMLAFLSILNVDYEFVDLFKKADKYLPSGSKLIDYRLNIADGLNVCSIKDATAGELKRHQEAMFTVASYASRVMNGCGYGLEYLNAAESSLYTGDLKRTKKYAYEAIYRSREYQQCDIEYMANFVLVRIFTAKGNYEEITNILDQMKTRLETNQFSDLL